MKENRNTIQKRLVLEAVKALANHPTAEEVYDFIVQKYGNISKATVYNNLQTLAKNEEIRRLDLPNEPTRYDHQIHDAYHFFCSKCCKLFDSDVRYDDRFAKEIKQQTQFQIDEINVILKGTCPDCINNSKKGDQE